MLFLSLLILFIIYHFWVVHRLKKRIKQERFKTMCYKSALMDLRHKNYLK